MSRAVSAGAGPWGQAVLRLVLEGGLVQQAGEGVLLHQGPQLLVDLADLPALEEQHHRVVASGEGDGQGHDGGDGQVQLVAALQHGEGQGREQPVPRPVGQKGKGRGHLDEHRQPQHRGDENAGARLGVPVKVVGVHAPVPQQHAEHRDVLHRPPHPAGPPPEEVPQPQVQCRHQKQGTVHAEVHPVVPGREAGVGQKQHPAHVEQLHAEDHHTDHQQGDPVVLQGVLPKIAAYLRGVCGKILSASLFMPSLLLYCAPGRGTTPAE